MKELTLNKGYLTLENQKYEQLDTEKKEVFCKIIADYQGRKKSDILSDFLKAQIVEAYSPKKNYKPAFWIGRDRALEFIDKVSKMKLFNNEIDVEEGAYCCLELEFENGIIRGELRTEYTDVIIEYLCFESENFSGDVKFLHGWDKKIEDAIADECVFYEYLGDEISVTDEWGRSEYLQKYKYLKR